LYHDPRYIKKLNIILRTYR